MCAHVRCSQPAMEGEERRILQGWYTAVFKNVQKAYGLEGLVGAGAGSRLCVNLRIARLSRICGGEWRRGGVEGGVVLSRTEGAGG